MKTGRDMVRSRAWRGGLVLAALVGSVGVAFAAPASTPHASTAGAQSADPDVGSRNVVARARMLECGHQWSNMKRAGTASGTWKDFSRGCLAGR